MHSILKTSVVIVIIIFLLPPPGREAAVREAKGTGRSAIAAAATRRALLAATVQGWRRISPAKEENAASHFILIPEKLRAAWAFRRERRSQ